MGTLIKINLWFDGGTRGHNPGMGYGSYQIALYDSPLPPKRLEFNSRMTNNEAEYQSLIAGLRNAIAYTDLGDLTALKICSDSKLVVNQVLGKWRCKKMHLQKLKEECLELLANFTEWKIKWEPRARNVERFGH